MGPTWWIPRCCCCGGGEGGARRNPNFFFLCSPPWQNCGPSRQAAGKIQRCKVSQTITNFCVEACELYAHISPRQIPHFDNPPFFPPSCSLRRGQISPKIVRPFCHLLRILIICFPRSTYFLLKNVMRRKLAESGFHRRNHPSGRWPCCSRNVKSNKIGWKCILLPSPPPPRDALPVTRSIHSLSRSPGSESFLFLESTEMMLSTFVISFTTTLCSLSTPRFFPPTKKIPYHDTLLQKEW